MVEIRRIAGVFMARRATTVPSRPQGGEIPDQHYVASVREHAEAAGLRVVQAPAGQRGKVEAHEAAASIVNAGRLRLPKHERLVRQLGEVTSRPTPGGGVKIDSPRWRSGGHGDLVSALVLALWAARRYVERRTDPAPRVGGVSRALLAGFGDDATRAGALRQLGGRPLDADLAVDYSGRLHRTGRRGRERGASRGTQWERF